MNTRRLLARVLTLFMLGAPLLAPAQNIVFDDAFTGDALNAATYPAVTPTSTGWNVASNKNSPAPVESGGVLTINMASTTSGFVETQALFAPAPVQLLPGTYLELTATFVPTYVVTNTSDNLVVGLFNSGGSAPASGMLTSQLSSGLTNFATGGAKGWLGFNANFPLTGATAKMLTRPPQGGTTNVVQDVLFNGQSTSVGYTGSATLASTSAPSLTFTNGSTYTLNYRLSLSADGNTLTAAASIYSGVGTSGTGGNPLLKTYSANATGGNLLTKAFDALALGWRADAGNPSNIKLSALTVRTTGGKPWWTTQPPASLLASLGSDLSINAAAGGIVTSYRWQKSTDGGASYVDIDTVANPSAATTTLTLPGIQYTDAGVYRLVATNAAGTAPSSPVTVTVTSSPVAPTIITPPTSGTVSGGSPYTFSAVVNGTSPLNYQWEKSSDGVTFAAIGGANSVTYTLAAASLADEGWYRLVVTNVAGSTTSAAATLTVNQPLAITQPPTGAALNLGDTFTLSVVAVGKPAPTYQWALNGTAIAGATDATYTITSASAANAGIYTVTAANTAGDAVTSAGAAVTVLSPTLAPTARTPASTATGLQPDTRLTITFNQPIAVGLSGQIRIYDTANPALPVETIDIASGLALMKTLRAAGAASTQPLPVQTKTIGGLTNFHYYPITVSGNTATIYPTNKALTYGKTYSVVIEPGVFTDATGLSFAGLTGSGAWTFTTRFVGPDAGATRVVVAADGSGDFNTVQGALDFIPAGNTTPRTIYIQPGTYFEQVYFTGKHAITLLGANRDTTIIAYPNNNNFNNVSGTYHRMVVHGDHVSDFTLLNLTIRNTTPKGGSQAEALVLNGTTTARAIVSHVNLVSYQDTLLINGQAFVADSHISGDVDYMWGNGPNYFTRCQLTAVTSGGYSTQIRNGSGAHGNVYVDCTLDALPGVSGVYLARIDPTPANFPFSEVVWLDCVMGTASGSTYSTPVAPAGWLLNNTPDQTAPSAPNVHFWEYNSHYSDGTPLNVSARIGASRQLTLPADATTIANYRTPSYVLNGWTPQAAPVIATQPVAQTVDAGAGFTLSVEAFAVPSVSYQWLLNGTPIPGATDASYTVAAAGGSQAGNYAVVVSNGVTTTTSTTVPLVVHGAAPVIARAPTDLSALAGTTATFSAWALGDGPLAYQWSRNGVPVAGATRASLRLTGLTDTDAGSYAVAVTNAGGTTTSGAATLTIVTPATTLPIQPVIPGGVFDVTAYGAVGDGVTDNTAAIQAALSAATAAGGGTVEFPAAAGAYLSGPLTMGSNTNLQLDGGAILQALPFGTYPRSFSAPAHFLTITSGATNVEISGSGVIEGDGAPWWAAFDASVISGRPRLVQITKASNVLFSGVTFRNSPNFHLAFSGLNNNVTIFGVTVTAPGDSPNTDGMDLAGTNFLVQHCAVSVGDDDIVAKPGSVFCRNLYIADCAIGTGHGISVGGQTNVGMDGMVVTNCTFNGTDVGLRLKADATQGGPVQNITYANITMTNVPYPILFYSYYNQLGSPGAKSGSSQTTPAKVNTWNAAPPNALGVTTIPSWRNITVTNLTATGASGYSVLWGVPLADGLVGPVTLDNVNITGGAGLELYDAANIQLTGNTSVGPIVTCNALAITGQPQGATLNVGDSITFNVSAVGASGMNNTAPTYRWSRDGVPLNDGAQPDGSILNGVTTPALTLTNARVTAAGNYTVTVSNQLDGFDVTTSALVRDTLPVSATSSAAKLTVQPLPATLTVSGLTTTYDGTPKAPTVTTTPADLAVAVAYDGGVTPVNAGSYGLTATIADPNYTAAPVTATLVIQPAAATVTLLDLEAVYDGTAHPVTVNTAPAGVAVGVTYNGAPGVPVAAGSYAVEATVVDPNYAGSAAGTLTIRRATPVVTWAPPAPITYGTPLGAAQLNAAASTPGTFTYAPAAGTLLNAGPNQALSVTFAPADSANYTGAQASTTITVEPAAATITLAPLSQAYDGLPKTVTATTNPAGLTVNIDYSHGGSAPVYPGEYPVTATVDEPNYRGTTEQTLRITTTALTRHATLNGGVDGSVQLALPQAVTLNSSAWIGGDLLVVGTPNLRLNGHPTLAGTIDGPGASAPSDYTVTLNSGAVLRNLVRRIDPPTFPVVNAPAAPTGTRSVALNKATDSAGDFATVRDLTLNGNVSDVAVPPGVYGNLTANGGSGFVLGRAGATEPEVYGVQTLTLNGNARVRIAGPVLLIVARPLNVSGSVGEPAHPEWLTVAIAGGGLTANGNARLYAFVIAPNGAVTLNGQATLTGEVISDSLTLNGGALLTEP